MTGVVLLHAFPYSPEMWQPQFETLAGLPVVAPEYLGLELNQAAKKILGEVEGLGWEQAVLVGLSMGGYVSFRIWEQAASRVAALVLADTRATPDDEAGKAARYSQAERIRREGTAWLPDALIPNHLGVTTRKERPELIGWVRNMIAGADGEKVARSLEALASRPDSTLLLPSISVPTLVLVGEEDTLTPPAVAEAMAEAIPQSELQLVPRAGHMANLENPEMFNRALHGFLARNKLLAQ